MNTSHRYTVQFRIVGKIVDPRNVTLRLGLQPSQIRNAGERRSETSVWDESLWAYDGTDLGDSARKEWDSLEDGLVFLLDILESRQTLIRPYIANNEAIWWCGHFQSSFDGGPILSPGLLNRLGAFGAPIFIDNYLAAGDEEDSEP